MKEIHEVKRIPGRFAELYSQRKEKKVKPEKKIQEKLPRGRPSKATLAQIARLREVEEWYDQRVTTGLARGKK